MSKEARRALEALENLTRYDMVRANIFRQFHPTATGDYVNLQEFREKAKPVITALREALAEQPARPYRLLQDNGSKYFGDSWDKAEQPAQQALDKMAENARELGIQMQPAQQQEPVAFLANGTRFKISYDSRQSGGQIHGIPPELGGRWVAFVAADDDCHLKLTSPPAQRKPLTFSKLCDIEYEITHRDGDFSILKFARAIEAAHGIKEKNT